MNKKRRLANLEKQYQSTVLASLFRMCLIDLMTCCLGLFTINGGSGDLTDAGVISILIVIYKLAPGARQGSLSATIAPSACIESVSFLSVPSLFLVAAALGEQHGGKRDEGVAVAVVYRYNYCWLFLDLHHLITKIDRWSVL